MHGRVKVRTSAEEKARKEKERQEKLKVFKHAMQKIQHKRKQNELDKELLDLTGKVLTSNPDIYTLWNIRRDIILHLRQNEKSEDLSKQSEDLSKQSEDLSKQSEDLSKQSDDLSKQSEDLSKQSEDLSKLHDDELQLTEYCLKINHKSYCAWHQREWVLTTRSDPDWQRELDVCNKYLKFDERNFHTWDYRRFVVSQCKPSLKEEFDFTTEKIHDNFSNYSAWHYRSKMLVELFPDLEGGRPIEDGHHKHELKLVQSAAFTDPDDTSAWFYQRWLLGAVKTTISMVVCAVSPSKTTVAFSHHVSLDVVKSKISLFINDTLLDGEWGPSSGNQYDNLWILKHARDITNDLDIRIEYDADTKERQIIKCVKVDTCEYIGKSEISFQKRYSKPVIEELNNQLVACRQLLEMEPDNKWTLLTTTVFLHCINAALYHEEAIKNLHELKKIDKLRSGYYDDLITQWTIEAQLLFDYKTNDSSREVKFHNKITSLPNLQYYSYCNVVDFSNQNLTSNILPSLVVLQHCKILNLAYNKLTTLKGFPVLDLKELHLEHNEDLDKDEETLLLIKKNCSCEIFI